MTPRIALIALALLALAACGADGEPTRPTVSGTTTVGVNSGSGPFVENEIGITVGF